jgi:hypothetical protein
VAFSDLERKRPERDSARFMKRRRPPEDIRPQLDIGVRWNGYSLEIFEIRPDWQDKSRTMEAPVAKTTYVRTRNHWRLFWMRRDLKWHGYEPNAELRSLEAVLNVIDRDEFCCFFG